MVNSYCLPMTLFVYILLYLLWGSTWLAIKVGLGEAPPFTTAAIRFLIATGVLWGISLVRGYKYPRDFRELIRIGYPGIFMYGMSYALVYFGQQYVNSATSAVLFGSYPFFVAALSWYRYRSEKLSRTAWIGMAVGFVGVLTISYDSLQTSGDLFLGTVLVVAAMVAICIGLLVAGESLTPLIIAGAVLILSGVLLVVRK